MNLKMKVKSVALCSLLLASAACKSTGTAGGGAGGGATNGGNATTSAAAAVISANDKPLDVMTRATRAQLDAKSYRANITNTLSSGATNTVLVEYAAPDRYHMSTHAPAGGRDTSLEYIIVGKDTFVRMNGGEWKKLPLDMSQMITAFRDPKLIDEVAKASDMKFVGTDTLNGAPMLVYEYTLDNALGMKMKSHAKTWVAAADGLPRKSESDGEFNGVKTKTSMTVSDYNTDIKIEPPVK
ncbi:MAG: hypothetical protein ACJ741_00455 [Pyrinomonadaceae bacterium]